MPERGECGLVVVPGGSEVGPSTVRRVQTPSRLGGGGSREGQDTHTHTNTTQRGNGTNMVRKKGLRNM